MADESQRDRLRLRLGGFMIAVLLGGLLLGPASRANAKPVIYPVKLTPIKIKSAELPPDSPYWQVPGITETPIIALYGRVTSAKPACRRQQPIIAVNQPSWAAEPEEHKRTGIVTDSTGYWEGEALPDFDFTESIRSGKERTWVKVVRKRLGKGRFCAEAISPRLKA